MMPGLRVDWKEAREVWVMEEADNVKILKVTNRASQGIMNENSSRWKGGPPPPQEQHVQVAANATPPGPPRLASDIESEQADFQ